MGSKSAAVASTALSNRYLRSEMCLFTVYEVHNDDG